MILREMIPQKHPTSRADRSNNFIERTLGFGMRVVGHRHHHHDIALHSRHPSSTPPLFHIILTVSPSRRLAVLPVGRGRWRGRRGSLAGHPLTHSPSHP